MFSLAPLLETAVSLWRRRQNLDRAILRALLAKLRRFDQIGLVYTARAVELRPVRHPTEPANLLKRPSLSLSLLRSTLCVA